MQVGGSGGLRSDINVTPLVDVVLVLLIIFMVITPVVQMGYLVKVPPKAPPVQVSAVQDQIVMRLFPDGRIMINKEAFTPEQFPVKIQEILKGNTSKMVFFAGDKDLNYEQAVKFLDTARAAGAQNIGIIVEDLGQAVPLQPAPAAAPAGQ
jgi:biopolymer transport protein TolR